MLDYGKLVKYVGKNPETSQRAAAEDQGLTIGQVSMLSFCKAKVDAGVEDTAPATGPSVKRLRDADVRWEMIAAKTNKSVTEVKALFDGAGGVDKGTGRGRPVGKGTGKKPAAKTKPAATRGRPKGSTNKPKAGIQRNRTRRGAGNPS
jgi:hypothetical protein